MNLLRHFSLAFACVFLAACGTTNVPTANEYLGGRTVASQGGGQSSDGYDPDSFWDAEGVSGPPLIIISLKEQNALYYRGNTLVGRARISTGREGHYTPAGDYKVIGKSKNHVSNLWGSFVDAQGNVVKSPATVREPMPPGATFKGSPMPYFIRLTNGGIGLHAGYLPGYPASAGCIRMPAFMAQNFFSHTEIGTPVRITN